MIDVWFREELQAWPRFFVQQKKAAGATLFCERDRKADASLWVYGVGGVAGFVG